MKNETCDSKISAMLTLITTHYIYIFRYTSAVEEMICECMVVNPMERPFIDQILNKTQTLAKSSSHIAWYKS